jgi:3',5'-cyclic-AMP phosphodiesterase
MRIIQITDTHLYGHAGGSLRGVETDSSLRAVIREAFAQFPGFSALLVTGDIANEDPQGYKRFRHIFDSLNRPVLCIPGNHDDLAAMRQELSAPPFSIGGAHRFGDWKIIMLDSLEPGRVAGRLTSAELARLDRELALSRDQHVMVCLHHHPVPMGCAWLDEIGLANANEFWRLIEDFPQVRAVVWGHVHQQYEGLRGDVRLIATPSTCSQFLPGSRQFATDSRPPAYRSLRLHPDGRIETQVHWVDVISMRRAASG